ncbi:biotin transporter BioY [Natrinema salaciae]|uniref:Biotin transport system substrate-specific component n=1 Tax=Natrinema salaciae TaxID=1186196 RepID=A0A1H9S981_9EURY|nr:biotin transporter BioY [Natrinema salaciae]SER80729.1 biotin transport system substrate-specific component [Natrinema salaciae]
MATEGNSVDAVDDTVVRQFARAAVLAALVGATAAVSIPVPLSPAPITLQVLFVFLAGLVLGPVWGGFSLLLYLVAGAVGLPVFAGMRGGFGVLFGDSGGYLWSYPIAAGLIGFVAHGGTALRDLRTVRLPVIVGALVVGTIVIYGMGTAYMAWLLELSAWKAVSAGALPFIPGEILKMAAAIAVVRSGRLTPVRS